MRTIPSHASDRRALRTLGLAALIATACLAAAEGAPPDGEPVITDLPAEAEVPAAPETDADPGKPPESEEDLFTQVWDFQLFKVGENVIRAGQVVLTVVLVIVGLLVARLLTGVLRRRLLTRVRLDVTAAAAVEKVLFYLLVVLVVLTALQVLEIPLTLFAFLGGAIAIGLGFGAQNILNNFISGLILMFERPVRIGDFVEVDEHLGRIEEIRFRCTRIRRNDGVEVLVPNSTLLEKNVINWTLSDRRVRTSIRVGVVYGSPTDRVAELVRQAVDETDRIMKEPEPALVFDDFGNDALIFEIYFWTDVSSMLDLKLVCSAVRFRIDELFRGEGIVIAFPQRDTHLDTIRPLEVRVQNVPPGSESPERRLPGETS
jgi:small-conductance mechanosensitive channel